jgi:hypothetical protein
LLDLLGGPAGVAAQPTCAVLGTALGLGTLAIPGLPGTIETQTGLPLSALPFALQPELLTLANTLLFVQGSGCGLLPLAAERTACATDDDLAAQLQALKPPPTTGLPIDPFAFVPELVPPVGALVDAFRVLAAQGLPGAADVVTALEDAGPCEIRNRLRNIVPPALSPMSTPAAPSLPSAPTVDRGDFDIGVPVAPVLDAPAAPQLQVVASGPVASSRASSIDGQPEVPPWLQISATLALLALVFRSLAGRRSPFA